MSDEEWRQWWEATEDTPEHSELLNHLIHEDRAKKRGLTWNRERYRFETQGGWPIKFTGKDTWVTITESEGEHE